MYYYIYRTATYFYSLLKSDSRTLYLDYTIESGCFQGLFALSHNFICVFQYQTPHFLYRRFRGLLGINRSHFVRCAPYLLLHRWPVLIVV